LLVWPGAGDAFERPSVPGQPLAVIQDPVGRVERIELGIGAYARSGAAVVDRQRGATDNRRAGGRLQRACRRAVIAVGVRAHDGCDALACGRFQDRLDMAIAVRVSMPCNAGAGRTRINHGDILPSADEVGLRAIEGER